MAVDSTVTQIEATLTMCGEQLGDIVPEVYRRFFNKDAQAAQLMGHADQHMRGRMLEAVFDLLLCEEHLAPGGYLAWELDNHLDAYRATAPMYVAFFGALFDTVKDGVGEHWTDTHERAWRDQIDKVMTQVYAHRSNA